MSICNKLCLFLAILIISEQDSTGQCPEPSPCKCSWRSIYCSHRNLTSVPRLVDAANRRYYLSLRENPNLVITDDSFQNITLYRLDLDYAVNITLSDHAFKNQRRSLNTFSISSAHLKKIPQALIDLDQLQNLNIATNKIQNWNVRVMKKLGVSLTKIDISNTGLTSWPIWLRDMSNLQWLDISHNQIGVIPHNAFDSFHLKLKYLDIRYTGISRMPTGLQTVEKLSELAVGGWILKDSSFYESWLPRKSSLDTLHISYTTITKIPHGLNMSSSIRTLEIFESKIESIDGSALPANLTTLTISASLLIHVGAGTCSDSLIRLILSKNKIEKIEKDDFYNCVNLYSLDLGKNNIDCISPTAFDRLTHLRKLIIINNRLNHIPTAIQKLQSLENLNLYGNPLKCTCQDDWFPKWRRNTPSLINLYGECTNMLIDLDEFVTHQKVFHNNISCEVHTECTEITSSVFTEIIPNVYTEITPSVYTEMTSNVYTSSAVLLNQITLIKYIPVSIVLILQSV